MYRQLDPAKIVETADTLRSRVTERFPGSGLSQVAAEILQVAGQAQGIASWLGRPIVPLRVGVWLLAILLVALPAYALVALRMNLGVDGLGDLVQAIESAINDVVFLGLAIFFLLTWETRIKRRRALKTIHELRSLAHVIDMHQLTKDPDRLLRPGPDTASSPVRTMSPFNLVRYLDYCSEMLSLISKIAAVYVQHFDDTDTLSAVNDLENLTTGLSRKIWQKIMILERTGEEVPAAMHPNAAAGVTIPEES